MIDEQNNDIQFEYKGSSNMVVSKFLGIFFSILGMAISFSSLLIFYLSKCTRLLQDDNSKCSFFYDIRNHIELHFIMPSVSINHFFLISYLLMLIYYLSNDKQRGIFLHYILCIFAFVSDIMVSFFLIIFKPSLFSYIFIFFSSFSLFLARYERKKRSKSLKIELRKLFLNLKNNFLTKMSFIVYFILIAGFTYFLTIIPIIIIALMYH